MKLIFFFALFLVILWPAITYRKKRRVILGYSAEWFDDQVPPSQYDLSNLTHISRSFLRPNEDGTLRIPAGFFHPDLPKAQTQGVKLLASIGGESAGNANWRKIAEDPARTEVFLKELEREVYARCWDGVDIDWEPGPQTKRDGELFLGLMKAIRRRFPNKILTTALMAGEEWFSWIPWKDLLEVTDFINLMSYPLAGLWTGKAAHQANLGPSGLDGGKNVRGLVEDLLGKYKVPRKKLVLGLFFFGTQFPLARLGDSLKGFEQKDLAYFPYQKIQVMERSGEYRKFWDKTAQVPFMEKASGTPGVMTYDDPTSIALKWELAQKEGLAGVMFWHIGADQIEGQPILQLKLTSR